MSYGTYDDRIHRLAESGVTLDDEGRPDGFQVGRDAAISEWKLRKEEEEFQDLCRWLEARNSGDHRSQEEFQRAMEVQRSADTKRRRDRARAAARERKRERSRLWYLANRERILEERRKERLSDRERINARRREYYRANRKRIRKLQNEQYAANRSAATSDPHRHYRDIADLRNRLEESRRRRQQEIEKLRDRFSRQGRKVAA